MKEIKTKLIGISDILSPDEVKRYHWRWEDWIGHQRIPEQPQNVHAFCEDDVVITKVYQYSEQVFRAGVIQNSLRHIDPYRTPGEGGYFHPFWHEYHYWQVGEQLFHASNRLRGCGEGEGTLTFKSLFDLKKKIFFSRIVSVQLIIVEKGKRGGQRFEEAHCTLFNRRNEVLGQTSHLFVSIPMLYRRLWNKMTKRQPGAKEELKSLIERQIRFMTQRLKKQTPKDIISRLEAGNLSLGELDSLFLFFP